MFALNFTIISVFLQETHGQIVSRRHRSSPLRGWLKCLQCPSTTSHGLDENDPLLPPSPPPLSNPSNSTTNSLSRNILLVIGTLGLFNLCTQAYLKMLTVFFSSARPLGPGMSPDQLGYAFAAAIIACMVFQASCFKPIEGGFGYIWCYRSSFAISCVAFFLTPLIGLIKERVVLWIGLVSMLVLKIVTEFFGPTCALLLVSTIYLPLSNWRSPTLHHQNPR